MACLLTLGTSLLTALLLILRRFAVLCWPDSYTRVPVHRSIFCLRQTIHSHVRTFVADRISLEIWCPGCAQGKEKESAARIKKFMTIMDSMTNKELDCPNPKVFQEPSRVMRLARGSGCHPYHVQELIGVFLSLPFNIALNFLSPNRESRSPLSPVFNQGLVPPRCRYGQDSAIAF